MSSPVIEMRRTITDEVTEWVAAEGIGVPVDPTSDLRRDIDLELQRRADLYQECADYQEVRAWAYQRSQESFWFWRNNFAWVFDDVDRGVPIPYISWTFHDDLQAAYLGLEIDSEGDKQWRNQLGELHTVAYAKSRKVGFSVAVCAAAAWGFSISKERSGNQIFVSLQESRVDDNTRNWSSCLFGKLRNIMDWQPEWLQPRSWRKQRSSMDRHKILSCPERQSFITGLGANIESLRSMRGWRLFIDEANSITHLDAAMAAGQSVAPPFLGSSITSKGTDFGKLCHGEGGIPLCEPGDVGGVVYRLLHIRQHPRYDPNTEEGRARTAALKASMTPQAYKEEIDVGFSDSEVGLIWAQYYDPIFHEIQPHELREEMARAITGYAVEGWDFGDSPALTACVEARYHEATDTLYIMDDQSWEHGLANEVANDVGAMGYRCNSNPHGVLPDRVGDMADRGSNKKTQGGRRIKAIHGWKKNLRDEGIEIYGQQLDVEAAIKIVTTKLIGQNIKLMPAACRSINEFPAANECFKRYKRYLPKGVTPETYRGDTTPPPSKGKFSHVADGVQHIAWRIWGGV